MRYIFCHLFLFEKTVGENLFVILTPSRMMEYLLSELLFSKNLKISNWFGFLGAETDIGQ